MPKYVFLFAAIAPTVGIVLFAAWVYFYSPNREVAMSTPIWGLVAIQAMPIIVFTVHAALNKEVKSAELFAWFGRFVVLIPYAMFDYWKKFIWTDPNAN